MIAPRDIYFRIAFVRELAIAAGVFFVAPPLLADAISEPRPAEQQDQPDPPEREHDTRPVQANARGAIGPQGATGATGASGNLLPYFDQARLPERLPQRRRPMPISEEVLPPLAGAQNTGRAATVVHAGVTGPVGPAGAVGAVPYVPPTGYDRSIKT